MSGGQGVPEPCFPRHEVPPHAFVMPRTVGRSMLSALVPHANNVQIVGWIDDAARAHGDAAGLTRDTMHAQDRMWFVARHEIDYLAESFEGDSLVVATWISEVGKTTCSRVTRIWRQDASADSGWTQTVDALTRWVHIRLSTRKPTRILVSDLETYGWTHTPTCP